MELSTASWVFQTPVPLPIPLPFIWRDQTTIFQLPSDTPKANGCGEGVASGRAETCSNSAVLLWEAPPHLFRSHLTMLSYAVIDAESTPVSCRTWTCFALSFLRPGHAISFNQYENFWFTLLMVLSPYSEIILCRHQAHSSWTPNSLALLMQISDLYIKDEVIVRISFAFLTLPTIW